MDVFGAQWSRHAQKIERSWREWVGADDLVLVPGDISWAMKLDQAKADLSFIDRLPGRKLLTKGNHDFWWPKRKRDFTLPGLDSMRFLHGRAWREGNLGIAATRAWKIPGDSWYEPSDQRIYEKEIRFLEQALEELGDAEHRLCMLHYPPFNDQLQPGAFVELIQRHDIQHVIYGHLHGADSADCTITGEYQGVRYHLTSCDHIDFQPVLILET